MMVDTKSWYIIHHSQTPLSITHMQPLSTTILSHKKNAIRLSVTLRMKFGYSEKDCETYHSNLEF